MKPRLRFSFSVCSVFPRATFRDLILLHCSWPASVAQLDARPTEDQEVAGSTPPGRQHSFMEIDHEIFSTVILSRPLFQEGQVSVTGEECAQYWLTTGLSLPNKSVVR